MVSSNDEVRQSSLDSCKARVAFAYSTVLIVWKAEVRDGWILLFPKKWHIYEKQVTAKSPVSIEQGRTVADASITMLQLLNSWT